LKKFIVFVVITALVFAGCSAPNESTKSDAGDSLKIVCTVFPQYDWVRQILGDRVGDIELTLLQRSLADLHNYQPSVDDMITISACDLFIYVGGESDHWADAALRQAVNPDMIVLNLLETLGDAAKIEELFEGMQDDDDHDEDDHDDEDEFDEHVWLSLRNAEIFCAAIAEILSSLDADYAEQYNANLTDYRAALSFLDAAYKEAVDAAPVDTLLFGDRYPFRYLMDDYGLKAYAAFPGCSAETEASFQTMTFLVEKLDELNLNHVMVTEGSNQSIAKTIISNSNDPNRGILVLDSMQSVTSGGAASGAAYLAIMGSNLNVLKEALQ